MLTVTTERLRGRQATPSTPLLPLFWLVAGLLLSQPLPAANGFDLIDSLIPATEIEHGGPPRDGIPAIDAPRFEPGGSARFLRPDDPVLGVDLFGVAKAYPVAILNWHEIVNDWIGDVPLTITYCPLCGTGMAFRAHAIEGPLTFGVSGLLYNSDVILYDRETETLWSQILAVAIAGPLRGERLEQLPLTHTTWRAWLREHPETLVLSTDTGYHRDYASDPYPGYARSRSLLASVAAESRRYHPKEVVLGVEISGIARAYPLIELGRAGADFISDRIGEQDVLIRFDREARSARAYTRDGAQIPAVTAYWFAWYAFHPDTSVFEADEEG